MAPAMTPAAPAPSNETFRDYRTFEAVHRPPVNGRRCSPMANTHVALDRVLAGSRPALLLRRAHPCVATWNIADDALGRSLHPVGLAPLDAFSDPDGSINVVLADCPGVRLRALIEETLAQERALPHEVVWHLIDRGESLRQVWARLGLAPRDTFVGFDGSLHFFPDFEACSQGELPSWNGDEIWDPLLPDETPQGLAALLCGQLPPPFMAMIRDQARRNEGQAVAEPQVPPAVHQFSAQPRTHVDATEQLGALARALFPDTFLRHQAIYQSLGLNVETFGHEREAQVRAARARETYPTGLRLVEPPPPRTLPAGHLPLVSLAMEATTATVGQLRSFLRSRGERPWFPEQVSDGALATGVPYAVAEAYARAIGRRLPTQSEWARSQAVHGTGLWEWTSTQREGGRVVCRGTEWRLVRPPYAPQAGGVLSSVSFRCVMDVW